MSGTATNVTTGSPKTTGAVFYAPAGSTLPTSASASLDAAFKELGYLSEDGVTEGTSMSSTNIKEWGGAVVLVTQDEKSKTFKFKMIEHKNANVHKFVNGSSNVTESGGAITITENAKDPGDQAIVIDQVLRGNIPFRIVIPRGKITALSDITYKSNDAIGYETTVQACNDDSGNCAYKYIAASGGSSS